MNQNTKRGLDYKPTSVLIPYIICLRVRYIPDKAIDGDSASFFGGDHDIGILTVKFWLGLDFFWVGRGHENRKIFIAS